MENQRKTARANALAQDKKSNTSIVVGAAAIGVPKVDPNMKSAKIANRVSSQSPSAERDMESAIIANRVSSQPAPATRGAANPNYSQNRNESQPAKQQTPVQQSTKPPSTSRVSGNSTASRVYFKPEDEMSALIASRVAGSDVSISGMTGGGTIGNAGSATRTRTRDDAAVRNSFANRDHTAIEIQAEINSGEIRVAAGTRELERLREAFEANPTQANADAYNYQWSIVEKDVAYLNECVDQHNYYISPAGIQERMDATKQQMDEVGKFLSDIHAGRLSMKYHYSLEEYEKALAEYDRLQKEYNTLKTTYLQAIRVPEQERQTERLLAYNIEAATNQLEACNMQIERLEKRKKELEIELKCPSVSTSITTTQEELDFVTALLNKRSNEKSVLEQDIYLAGILQEDEKYAALPESIDFAYYVNQGVALAKRDSAMKSDVDQLEQNVVSYNNLNMPLEMQAAQAELEWLNSLLEKDTKGIPGTKRDIEQAKLPSGRLPAPEGNSVYEYMTDEERQKYYYLRGKDGKAAAQTYLDGLMDFLNSRKGTEMGEAVRGIDNPFGRTVATGIYGLGSGVDQYVRGVQQWLRDERQPVSPMQYGSQYIRNDLADVGRRIGSSSTGQILYDGTVAVGNMLPSMVVSSVSAGLGAPVRLSKALGAASIGLSSAGNYYNEMLSQYPPEKARQVAKVVGASEAALQYVLGGIGKVGGLTSDALLERAASIENTLIRLAASGAIKVGSELAEEELQLFLEPFYRTIVLNEDYDAPTWNDMMETAMVTILTTGALEGPGLVSEAGRAIQGDYFANRIQNGIVQPYGNSGFAVPLRIPAQTSKQPSAAPVMADIKTPEQRNAEDLGGMSNPVENKTAPVIDQSEKNGAHVVEVPLLLPEVSELSVQRGYPYNRKDAVYKVVEISQEKVDEIENYINTTTTPEVKKKFKVILKNLFGGQKFTNVNAVANEIAYEIGISSRGIGEIISRQPVDARVLAMLEKLNEVVENAKYVASEPTSHTERKAIKRTDVFEADTIIGETPEKARFRVNVTPQGNKLYFATIKNAETQSPQPWDRKPEHHGIEETASANPSIPNPTASVNPENVGDMGADTSVTADGAVVSDKSLGELVRWLKADMNAKNNWETDWDVLEQLFFRYGFEAAYGETLRVQGGEGVGELQLSREQIKELSDMYNKGVYELFREVLREEAPVSLEEFCKIRYDNGDAWQQLKKDFAVVERYEVRGNVPVKLILELDRVAFDGKRGAFDYSKFHGDDRDAIKELRKGGNAAVMIVDGNISFAHSKVNEDGTLEYSSYVGQHPLIGISSKRIFEVLDLGDGIPRECDTEAKFLEYVASVKTDRSDAFTVTILSEKHICKSCEYVVEQFKELFPNATVNIVSGNPNYGEVNSKGEHGMKTWKHRKD